MKIRSHLILILVILSAVPILYLASFAIYINTLSPEQAVLEKSLPHPRYFVAIFALIFEAIFIALSLFMLARVAKSIRLVEREAKKLDDGDIEQPIQIPMNKGYSNEITNLLTHMESFRKMFKQRKKQRDTFVMGLSHDLKTPLAIIKGYAEGLSDGIFDEPDKKAEVIDIIIQKTSQLGRMVDELVNFVKMNETDWTKDLVDVDLGRFIKEFSTYVETTCQAFEREPEISFHIPEGTIVKMDERMANRALGNIFSNALRYSKPGTKISFSAGIEEGQDGRLARVVIADQGIGMSKEETDRIFELFYRGTNSRREQGHGIGLSVVKTVIGIHGWDIKVESEAKKGSRFIITIPLKG